MSVNTLTTHTKLHVLHKTYKENWTLLSLGVNIYSIIMYSIAGMIDNLWLSLCLCSCACLPLLSMYALFLANGYAACCLVIPFRAVSVPVLLNIAIHYSFPHQAR